MEETVPCALCSSLGSKDGNFLPNTDEAKKNHVRIHLKQSKIIDDGISEDEILQRCFKIRQPKVGGPTSKKECRRLLLDLCNLLLKHHSKSAPATCNLCAVGILTRPGNMIRHVYAHFEVKLFKCRHCDRSMSNGESILQHIRREHHVLKPTDEEDFEDKTVEQFDEISNQLRRCFSADQQRASGIRRQLVLRGDCRGKSHQSAVHLCRSLYLQRSKPSSLDCNLCETLISMGGRSFQASTMHQHAAAHLEVKLFTCLHCNRSMSTKCTLRQHLKDVHHIVGGNNNDFEDQSDKVHSEYLSMIERCFSSDQSKRGDSSIKVKSTVKAESIIRIRTAGSKLNIERHLFCNRLFRKNVDSDGKLECSLCSKRVRAKLSEATWHHALVHAEVHLQKPLYRCKVCKRSFNTHGNIAWHLKWTHALGMTKNYERIADEYHEEFMAMLSKCFPTKGSENSFSKYSLAYGSRPNSLRYFN